MWNALEIRNDLSAEDLRGLAGKERQRRPGAFRKTRHRRKERVGWMLTLTATAYDLTRLPRLMAAS